MVGGLKTGVTWHGKRVVRGSSSAADRACVARSPATYGSFDPVPDASKPKNNSGRCRLESKSMTATRIRLEPQGSVSLCNSCHWAHIQHGFAESEEPCCGVSAPAENDPA